MKGYPFHVTAKDLLEGSQIMAVADVFTAVAVDRPYRAGMTRSRAITVLEDMVASRAINGDIVSIMKNNYDEIDEARVRAQNWASAQYRTMNRQMKKRR